VCGFVFTENDPVWGVNAGLVALAANLVVALAVTYAGPREHDDRPDDMVLARDEPGSAEDLPLPGGRDGDGDVRGEVAGTAGAAGSGVRPA